MARQPQGTSHRSQATEPVFPRRGGSAALTRSHLRLAQAQAAQAAQSARAEWGNGKAAEAAKRAAPELTMKLAAIDIGSNAVRLLLVNVYEGKDGPNFKKQDL